MNQSDFNFDKWLPMKEELIRQLGDDTSEINLGNSPKFAVKIVLDLVRDSSLERKALLEKGYKDSTVLSNSANVNDVVLAFKQMADMCQVLDYGPAGAWLGVFCEEVLAKYNDAQYWYNKAASFGNGIGMYRVGLLYLTKKVPLPQQVSLKRCFTDALENGVPEAQQILEKYF